MALKNQNLQTWCAKQSKKEASNGVRTKIQTALHNQDLLGMSGKIRQRFPITRAGKITGKQAGERERWRGKRRTQVPWGSSPAFGHMDRFSSPSRLRADCSANEYMSLRCCCC
nr:uncharacterized protein LOC129525560 [Gorilla gorilla gorilla]